jgi:hypothetical protein
MILFTHLEYRLVFQETMEILVEGLGNDPTTTKRSIFSHVPKSASCSFEHTIHISVTSDIYTLCRYAHIISDRMIIISCLDSWFKFSF